MAKQELPNHELRRKSLKTGSDVEIAELVARDLEKDFGNIVFADGGFYYFGKTHWVNIDDALLRRWVHLYDGAVYFTPDATECAVRLGESRIKSVIAAMSVRRAEPKFFTGARVGINCASGFILFDADGKPRLEPHHPDHRCRHSIAGYWQSGAVMEEPPEGTLLHKLVFGAFRGDSDAADKRKLIAEACASAATGYATKLRRPRAIVLLGELAENGKSQFLELARSALPPSAVSAISASKLSDQTFIVSLVGKLLNATDELSRAAAIAGDTFKRAITGEPMEGRDVYRSKVEFRPVAQHLYSVNALPKFSGGIDRGVRRRLRVVQFNRTIPDEERVEDIGRRVASEEPDILLAWIVTAATRLIRQREFTAPSSGDSAMRTWLDQDPVVSWANARIEPPVPGYEREIKSRDAYAQFRAWAIDEGFKEADITPIQGFAQRLREHIPTITVKHRKSGNYLVGLTILNGDRTDPDEADGPPRPPLPWELAQQKEPSTVVDLKSYATTGNNTRLQ
jgi:phage/plasmid-associated DNA primase